MLGFPQKNQLHNYNINAECPGQSQAGSLVIGSWYFNQQMYEVFW